MAAPAKSTTKPTTKQQDHKGHAHHDHDGHDHGAKPGLFSRLFGKR